MTPQERTHSKIIDGSRRARIAKGSGVQVSEVNNLLTRFAEAQKMMKQMGKGGESPGMPGMGGGKKSRGRQVSQGKKSKKGRSGNPAKRAAQEAAAATTSSAAPGSGLLGGDFRPERMLRVWKDCHRNSNNSLAIPTRRISGP